MATIGSTFRSTLTAATTTINTITDAIEIVGTATAYVKEAVQDWADLASEELVVTRATNLDRMLRRAAADMTDVNVEFAKYNKNKEYNENLAQLTKLLTEHRAAKAK